MNPIFRSLVHYIIDVIHWGVNIIFPKNKYKIIFQSGPDDYVDNSRALSDYILKNEKYNKYKIYWAFKSDVVKNVDPRIRGFNRISRFGKILYFYHTVTAKYLFSTHAAFEWSCSARQKYFCLWHGTMLKKIACLQDPIANKYYMRHCKMFASPSIFYNEIVGKSFGRDNSFAYNTGYPRTDLLFEKTDSLNKLSLNKEDKIVLYMPTFRTPINSNYSDSNLDIYEKGVINFKDNNSVNKWNEYLKTRKIQLIVKPHPSDANIPSEIKLSNIKVLTNSELSNADVQLYHLLNEADALLTDFSSVFCDYLVLNRPIGFVVTDLEEYSKGRGFVFDAPIDYMPGVIIKNTNQFKLFLDEISNGIDSSKFKRESLFKIYNDYNDNNNCSRVLSSVGIE